MAKRGFNHSFRLYLEGVLTPFKSASVVCTPNGVEANVSVFSNKTVLDLKPKTAVQIFYRDFISTDGKFGWRLMFDGFFSSFYKTDDSVDGRHIGLTCRDFRMDIRRSPAALAYQDKGPSDLGIQVHYNTSGLFKRFVVKGVTPKGKRGSQVRTYGNSGIDDIGEMLRYIAGTAYGKGLSYNASNGEYYYSDTFGKALKPSGKEEKADGRLFLDSFIRGIWLEATGGTSVNSFLNKRIRVDKRFLVPSNQSGYNFWKRMNAGIQGGGYLLGNSRFTSVEAAIMRLAGLFSTRVYSCNTPSLISIDESSPGVDNIIADGVRKFLVDRASAEFGAKYILNESMLLPPLEFTAPPNCNLIFPPMCHRITWQYDIDSDVTRGYFKQVDVLATPGSKASLSSQSYQVPNALFSILAEEGDSDDRYGRKKPPLTLEERYKGVNVYYGSVEYALAGDDTRATYIENNLNTQKAAELRDEIADLEEEYSKITGGASPDQAVASAISNSPTQADPEQLKNIKRRWETKMKEKANATFAKQEKIKATTSSALKHHSLIKFLNLKYAGRVATVDMHFNPYIMSGFPAAIIADELGYGGEALKTVLGMVQQVKHTIMINTGGAEASTSVVINNARFEDEPTDIDKWGNPLYMKPTVPSDAEIDINTLEYKVSNYSVPDPEPTVKRDIDSEAYDLNQNVKDGEKSDYIYAKDLLTLTARDKGKAVRNTIYIDQIYEPNYIAKFYTETFPHFSDHFMIGNAPDPLDPKQRIFFMYDTVHEALQNLRNDKKLMTDYQTAMLMVMRDVCSADAFFQGILGLSRRTVVDKKVVYVSDDTNFVSDRILDEYFGVTTESWESSSDVENLKKEKGGLMDGPGQMSSILETVPVTAFIKERQDAVKAYVADVNKYSQGAQFSNAVR